MEQSNNADPFSQASSELADPARRESGCLDSPMKISFVFGGKEEEGSMAKTTNKIMLYDIHR